MSEQSATDEQGMAGLRPLSACVAGAGVMTLGVLQFLGQVWSAVPEAARQDLLVTVRVAFFGFLFTLAALVLAWLGQRVGGTVWRAAITLFGLFAFAGTAFGVALGIGRALGKATPLAQGVVPADGVLAFLGAAMTGLLLLAVILVVMVVRQVFKGGFQ